MKRIVFIGLGSRIAHIYKQLTLWEPVEIAAICDPDPEGATARLKVKGFTPENIRFYRAGEQEKMLDEVRPDGVLAGTRCDLHTAMALPVLQRELPLFLEKPVGITARELALLEAAGMGSRNTVVSFPLRLSVLAQTAKKIVDSGVLGPISQIQAVNK